MISLAYLSVVSAVIRGESHQVIRNVETLNLGDAETLNLECKTKLKGTFEGTDLGKFLTSLVESDTDVVTKGGGWSSTATKASAGCEAAAFLETLEAGVQKAGFFKSSTLVSGTSVTVTHKSKLQGEIGTHSRVPVKWVLEEVVTYSFGSPSVHATELYTAYKAQRKKAKHDLKDAFVALSTDGVALVPFRQGMTVFKRMVDPVKCFGKAGRILADCELQQIKEFDSSGSFVPAGNENSIEDVKIGRVMSSLMGYKSLIDTFDGELGWPKILYAITTASPKKISDFVFYTPKKAWQWDQEMFLTYDIGAQDGQTKEEWEVLNSRVATIMDDAETKKFNVKRFKMLIGTEYKAGSGITFAAVTGIQTNQGMEYGGDPAKFTKLARGDKACPDKKAGAPFSVDADETDSCTNTAFTKVPTRVTWREAADSYYTGA